jgi:hypothetical protein
MRFGLKDINELPSIEEFEKLTSAAQSDLFVEGGGEQTNGNNDASVSEIADQKQASTPQDEQLDTKAAS